MCLLYADALVLCGVLSVYMEPISMRTMACGALFVGRRQASPSRSENFKLGARRMLYIARTGGRARVYILLYYEQLLLLLPLLDCL